MIPKSRCVTASVVLVVVVLGREVNNLSPKDDFIWQIFIRKILNDYVYVLTAAFMPRTPRNEKKPNRFLSTIRCPFTIYPEAEMFNRCAAKARHAARRNNTVV